MVDEFDFGSSSEPEEIDNFEFEFDDLTEIEINRICKERSENEYFEEHKINKKILSSGIVEVKYSNGEIYKTWKVEFIKPHIIKYLKKIYPNSLIVPEVNKIDLAIFDITLNDQIPVEIQKTPINSSGFGNSRFEDMLRRQIEDNIENYNKCLLFFDSEYLRYLQSENVGKTTSINMTWIVNLIRETTLKAFSIKYDGTVKELTTKDFDFLKYISQKCIIGYDNDDRILNRNKLKICYNVLIGNNFSQEEIDNFFSEYQNSNYKKENGSTYYFRRNSNKRCSLYGHIYDATRCLNSINNCLDMNSDNPNDKLHAISLGIFEVIGNNASGSIGHTAKFIDKFDICKYFPGYLRQEKHWLTYKGNELDGRTFSNMCGGMYKKASTIFDY